MIRRWWPELVSWVLAAVLTASTLHGLLAEHAYRLARTVELESLAQDALTLAVVPVLVFAGRRSRLGSARGHLLWLGLLSYVAYTYVIYAFGVPSNSVFLLYVCAMSLAIAALVDGIARMNVRLLATALGPARHRAVGGLLVVVGCAFAALWLSDLLPAAISGAPPGTVGVGGLPYPVYVVDLALVLPAMAVVGLALLRGHVAGPALAAVLLVKLLVMGLAIWSMAVAILVDGGTPNWAVAGVFAVLIAVCATVLARGAHRMRTPAPGWLREALWTENPLSGKDM
ncbi:hypothetical protein [Allokutzneria sp. NRRL B-24872]|uniref:hypothetical protein n=1 Tax=Allokutzneria sp. NRRL B-24872 TaxID=1137961 RepID=UPI000A39119C|nr:hypothetical protein [Allokutzneria sp. NRRL B-24872]